MKFLAFVRSRRPEADAGTSLTELVVVIALFALVGGAITAIAVAQLSSQRSATSFREAQADARLVLDRIRRDARIATAIQGPSTSTLLTLTLRNADGTTGVVHYRIDGGELARRLEPSTEWTVLSRNLAASPPSQFQYVNKPAGQPCTSVCQVNVSLSLRPPGGSELVMNDAIRLRNAW